MSDLSDKDFAQYFKDVHDHPPFPWQERLTTDVLETGKWPDVIDLPTGTGKTAVLDTAVFSLAIRPETFPRRVVFVIDRRIIVDQVRIRALRIQKQIKSGKTEVLRRLKAKLGAVGEDDPLGVSALRGEIPIDREWSRRPDLPWVVVSTVDQFGSRLLFSGYGVPRTSRPIHAGLAGNDCLVILDEVHISKPFSETLDAVKALPRGPLPRRFHVVKMSATPDESARRRFELVPTDLEASTELRRRVQAHKSAEVRTVPGKTKPPHEALPPQILRILKKQLTESVRCVGVVVNRVRTARETYQVLTEAGIKSHLVTGRMRPIDRQAVLDRFSDAVHPDRQLKTGDLTVVVATQTIEVGADFSFDALITECAPVDSLSQRFGRLDRRGTLGTSENTPARGWILGVPSSLHSKRPDPIYGESLRVTWEELQRLAARAPDNLIDVGPLSLAPASFPDGATAPKPNAPLLLTTYMEAWVQTNPQPIVQPSVDWFLHGIEHRSDPDVSLVWRWDDSSEALRLVPPRPGEYLQVPLSAAKAWLMAQAETDVADVDVHAPSGSSMVASSDESSDRRFKRWEGKGTDTREIRPPDIRPGDVIVVHPTLGGIRGGTWDPSSTSVVEDLGDPAQLQGRTVTLRLHPRYLGPTASPPRPADEANAHKPLRERVDRWLAEVDDLPAWTNGFICRVKGRSQVHVKKGWQRCRPSCNPTGVKGRFRIDAVGADDPKKSYYILTERTVDPATFDGSDVSSSFTGAWITLRDHLDGVGTRAAEFGRRLGFSDELVSSLRLAGRLHDLGKVDPRFQRFLVRGDPVHMQRIEESNEPLAKSPHRLSSGKHHSIPHPITSIALVESNCRLLSKAEPHDIDLVLHLIGTHHGHGRPFLTIPTDPNPQELQFNLDGHCLESSSDLVESSLALEHADRFWLLNERYGYHGLAWLEAILRLADWHESAEEQRLFEERSR